MTTVGVVVLTAAMVAHATGGRLAAGPEDRVFTGVSTDTRSLVPGTLFIALSGERFDAHAFLDRALAAGAAGLVVASVPTVRVPDDTPVIVVGDTLDALQRLARAVRRQSGTQVIAITGSAGKTTTKEVTADLLSSRYRVFRNRGNLNNHVGLPISLLELASNPDVAVVELGMNHAGEIRTLVGIAEPDVRVWTNVGDAHIGHFGSRDAIADAKAEILEGATRETLVIANADDPLVRERVSGSMARLVTFGRAADATVRAVQVEDRGFEGTTAAVRTPQGDLRLTVPLAGLAQLMNVLAATAVALEFGVTRDRIERTVAGLKAVARRGAMTRLASGATLVDDSYNASPEAVQAMLAALAVTPGAERRIAVLGEMLELGASGPTLHEACGGAAARAGVDELVVIGGDNAGALAAGARRGGLASAHIHQFVDSTVAAPLVAALIRPGDLVLVKGSRGTRVDIVADRLVEGA